MQDSKWVRFIFEGVGGTVNGLGLYLRLLVTQ